MFSLNPKKPPRQDKLKDKDKPKKNIKQIPKLSGPKKCGLCELKIN